MKIKILSLFFAAMPVFCFAQFEKGDKGTLFLVIKQKDNTPVVYEEVTLSEKTSGEKTTNFTDKKGNVQFPVQLGYTYVIGFSDAPHYAEFPIPLNRGNMITSGLVYNPPKKKKTMVMDTIWQKPGIKPGENNASVSIRLINKKPALVIHRKTYLVCQQAHQIYAAWTNDYGEAEFVVPSNMEFVLGVDRQSNLGTVNTLAIGQHLSIKKSLTYDPDRAPEISLNTDYILADTIVQHLTENDHPNAGESMVEIEPENIAETGVPGIPIRLMCPTVKKIFVAVTDEKGLARFIVPVDKNYWVGVEDYNDIDHIVVPKEDRIIITFSFTYEPTNIVEINKNDTIRQELSDDVHATTSRSFCHVEIKDYSENLLPDEPVYFKEPVSGKTYATLTDKDGSANILLPKGKKYYISFKYENNIDVLDVPRTNKLSRTLLGFTYRGSKNIEDFYANSDRDMNGFFKKFPESKVTMIDISDKQFAEKTDLGFKLNLPVGSPVSTPALAGDEMITSEGYYSPRFYGFNNKTGHTDWGVSLAEGGASNSVYEDGVVIVNTESCTLYAIDSKSGSLLWSHWLSNYLFTTPSIDHGKIYTVYANNLESSTGSHSFVLVCFDLHKGDIIWQSWLDANALASPVIDQERVYITTLDGKLSLFNAKDGKLVKESKINATTNPLVINNKIYISALGNDKNSIETVNILDANTLALIKKCTGLSSKYVKNENMAHSTIDVMNFAGTRMVHYKGKNYNVMGNKLLCTSPDDGRILWSSVLNVKRKDSAQAYATMPVIAGGKILIGTPDGKIKIYDPNTGKMTKEYAAGGEIWTQPMVHDGWIYTATHEGKLVSIDTHDLALTGWDMWNYNPRHNTLVE
jgi:outer membrane protein assembly factor BamB